MLPSKYLNDDFYTSGRADRDHSSLRAPTISRYFTLFLCAMTVFIGYLFGYLIAPIIDRTSHTGGAALSGKNHGKSVSSSFTDAPIIEFCNNYTASDPMTKDYPWEHIVEPYRVTYFTVANPIPSQYLADAKTSTGATKVSYAYYWYVNGWHKDIGETASISFTDAPGSKVTVEVQLKYSDAKSNQMQLIARSSIIVIVKYVRREIRTLFDRDREALFNAVSIMQHVPTHIGKQLTMLRFSLTFVSLGQQIYGKKYYSKDYFNRIHLYYGGTKSCDHWHQGPG
jgi:hypothetical protein